MDTSIQNLIKDFLAYLAEEKKRLPETIRNYNLYLRRFLFWVKNKEIGQVDAKLIKNYKLWLNKQRDKNGRTLQKNTQNYHLIALRTFLKYLNQKQVKALMPKQIQLSKLPKRQIEYLESSELEKFLAAPLNSKEQEIIKLRDKALLETLLATGLRVSELANLKKNDLNLTKSEILLRAKKIKPRITNLSNQARFNLQKYLAARKDKSEFIFTNHDRANLTRNLSKKDQALTPRSIQRTVQKYAQQAGLPKKVTPAVIRHTFALNQLKQGVKLQDLQEKLGLTSPNAINIYQDLPNINFKNIFKSFKAKKRKK